MCFFLVTKNLKPKSIAIIDPAVPIIGISGIVLKDVALIFTTLSNPAFSLPVESWKKAWTPQSPITSGTWVSCAYSMGAVVPLFHCPVVPLGETGTVTSHRAVSLGMCHLNVT